MNKTNESLKRLAEIEKDNKNNGLWISELHSNLWLLVESLGLQKTFAPKKEKTK